MAYVLFLCLDVNECNAANGGCEHDCTNTFGSLECSCRTGYLLDGNGLNCTGKLFAKLLKYQNHEFVFVKTNCVPVISETVL